MGVVTATRRFINIST